MPKRLAYSLAVCVLAAGCGHPASERECQQIVERIATLEIQKSNGPKDPKSVGEQIEGTKKSLRESTMKDCVGKRITERAMGCVRQAKSSEEIVSSCFQ